MTNRPHTLRSPIDGRILHRDVRPSTVSFGGKTVEIQLPGYYPTGAGEGFHFPEDLEVSDRALAQIKAELAQERVKQLLEKNPRSQSFKGDLEAYESPAFSGTVKTYSEPAARKGWGVRKEPVKDPKNRRTLVHKTAAEALKAAIEDASVMAERYGLIRALIAKRVEVVVKHDKDGKIESVHQVPRVKRGDQRNPKRAG